MPRMTTYSGKITGAFKNRGGFFLTVVEGGRTTHHLVIPEDRSMNREVIPNSTGLEAEVDMEDNTPVRVRIEGRAVMRHGGDKAPECG